MLFITTSYYEGFGLPPLEALACKCPVVSSNASSLPEVLGSDYPMVNPFDINGYMRQIRKVMENSSYRNTLIQRASKRIEQFSWEMAAEKTLKVYEDIWVSI